MKAKKRGGSIFRVKAWLPYLMIGVFLFQLFGLLIPQRALAESTIPETVRKYQVLKNFAICVEGADSSIIQMMIGSSDPVKAIGNIWDSTFKAGLSAVVPIEAGSPIGNFSDNYIDIDPTSADHTWDSSKLKVPVGFAGDSNDGLWNCGDDSHANEFFRSIGYSGYDDFRKQEYHRENKTFNANKSQGDLRKMVLDKINAELAKIKLNDEHKYYNLWLAFQKCATKKEADKIINQGDILTVSPYVDIANGNKYVESETFEQTQADHMATGFGMPFDGESDGFMKCDSIAKALSQLAPSYKDWVGKNGEAAAALGSTLGTLEYGEDDACLSNGGIFAWAICGLIEMVDKTIKSVMGVLIDRLEIDEATASGDSEAGAGLFEAWKQFRVIANILFVIIGLVVIASTALNIPLLDAYTVKKALPRLVIAVIGIQISWYLTSWLILANNALAHSVFGILKGAFPGAISGSVVISDGTSMTIMFAMGLAGLAAAIAGFFAVITPLALTIGFLILVSFFVIVLREGIIYILVLAAPVAFAAGVLPNTQKLTKLWWGTFSKALLMYPLILSLIAMGKILGMIILEASKTGSGKPSTSGAILSLVAMWAPFFMIPFTFKFAGGVIGSIGGFANDKSRGFIDKSRKKNAEKRAANVMDWKNQSRFQNRGVGRAINAVGGGVGVGWRGHFGVGLRGRGARDLRMRAAMMTKQKSDEMQAMQFEEDGLTAVAVSGGSRARAEERLRRIWQNADGTVDEQRVQAALQSGANIGYNRVNSMAAMELAAKNKFFGVAAGQSESARSALVESIQDHTGSSLVHSPTATDPDRVEWQGGDSKLAKNLHEGMMFHAKTSGATRFAGGDLGSSWGRTSMNAHAISGKNDMIENTQHAVRLFSSEDQEERRVGAKMLLEMHNLKNNTSDDNAEEINKALKLAGVDFEKRDERGNPVSIEQQLVDLGATDESGMALRRRSRVWDNDSRDPRGDGRDPTPPEPI